MQSTRFKARPSVSLLILASALVSGGVAASSTIREGVPESRTAWDILVNSSQRAFWDSATESAVAEMRYLEAQASLERTGVAESSAMSDVNQIADALERMGFERTTEESRREAAVVAAEMPSHEPSFNLDWLSINVGRGIDGRPYAEFTKDGMLRRVHSGERLDGWTISIDASGAVKATRGGRTITP